MLEVPPRTANALEPIRIAAGAPMELTAAPRGGGLMSVDGKRHLSHPIYVASAPKNALKEFSRVLPP